MRSRKTIIIAAVCALCLAGCGNSESKSDSKVSSAADAAAVTTTVAAAASEDSTEAESKAAEPASEAGSTADESKAEPAVSPDAPLAERAKMNYKGVVFGVGENIADIKDKLGKMEAPERTSQPCIPGTGESTDYSYDGMSISTNNKGVIYSISLNHDYTKSNEPSTAGGLHLEETEEDMFRILGKTEPKSEGIYTYEDGDLLLNISIYEGKILTLYAENIQLLME